jgi:CRP-like cAMP-binding protein
MKPRMAPQNHTGLNAHPLFAEHRDIWSPVLASVSLKRVAEGETVLQHGSSASALWLVLSGWVSLSRMTPDGKETIVGLCNEGDVFGEASLFPHANYPYHALSISDDTELACIPAPLMRELIAKHPELSTHVMKILGERIAKAQLKLEQMSTLSAPQRLGCFLLNLCHTQAHGEKTIEMPVEKHVIASFLGMKPETFSRSINQLGDVGIKVTGARVTVENISNLRDYVCGSCGESGMCSTEEAFTTEELSAKRG